MGFDCTNISIGGLLRVWIDDHLLCDVLRVNETSFVGAPRLRPSTLLSASDSDLAPLPPFMVLTAGDVHFVRVRFVQNKTASPDSSTVQPADNNMPQAYFSVRWGLVPKGSTLPENQSLAEFPTQSLAVPQPDHPQLARMRLQSKLSTGWGRCV